MRQVRIARAKVGKPEGQDKGSLINAGKRKLKKNVMQSLSTSCKQTKGQPVSEQWLPPETPFLSVFISEHSVMCQEISISSAGVNCAGRVYSQLLSLSQSIPEGVQRGKR